MRITGKARARMYGLTAVACAIWLVQSLAEAARNGSLLTWPNLIFTVCLTVVTVYCAVCAFREGRKG